GSGRIRVNEVDIGCKGSESNQKCDGEKIELPPPEKPQQQRPENIELLFNSKRPEVKQRLILGGGVEIARFLPEGKVGDKPGSSSDVFAQFPVLVGLDEPTEQQTGNEHRE